jgi:hypothetical protein
MFAGSAGESPGLLKVQGRRRAAHVTQLVFPALLEMPLDFSSFAWNEIFQ